MENELTGNGHTPVDSTLNLHAEFEHSPRSAANLLQQFRYRIQNNRTVRGAMSSMGGARDYMRDHSISDIAEEVQAMVRRKPGTALAVAALAGFLLGRAIRNRPS